MESARHFVLGCDHKQLTTSRYRGSQQPTPRRYQDERLLSLKEKTLPYRFSIIHIPGQKQKAPDANSRKSTDDPKKFPLHIDFKESDSNACNEPRLRLSEATMTWEPDISADLEEKLAVAATTNLGDMRAFAWAEVQEHTLRDENLQNIQKKDQRRFPGHHLTIGSRPGYTRILPIQGWTQQSGWEILYNNGTVIQSPLRALILDTVHSAHQGVSCMTSRRQFQGQFSVFWPAIANSRARCRSCNKRAPSQPHCPPLAAQEPVTPSSAYVRITSNTRAGFT